MKTPQLSEAMLNILKAKIQEECRTMCTNKPTKSLFKICSIDSLKKFDIEALQSELRTRAPTLFTFLSAAGSPTGRRKTQLAMVTMAAAVLLKARSQKMSMLQTLVASILYAGHASKRVRVVIKISKLLKNIF